MKATTGKQSSRVSAFYFSSALFMDEPFSPLHRIDALREQVSGPPETSASTGQDGVSESRRGNAE